MLNTDKYLLGHSVTVFFIIRAEAAETLTNVP